MAAITDLATLAHNDLAVGDWLVVHDLSAATDKKMAPFVTGTWTPALSFGGATTGITYGTQTGYYIRIGALVWVGARIVLTSKGSATGTATITGLPFALAAVAAPLSIAWTALGGAVTTMQAIISSGTAISLLYTTGSTSYTTATDATFGNTTTINIGGAYAAA